MKVNEKAYAKINLFLDVTGKREDGFHELVSVMHSVGLADEIEVETKQADYSCITLEMKNSSLPADERNLAYLAAEAFLDKTGITAAVHIRLEKHIPVCAGLGGGSSDAAAVLRAMNASFDNPLSVSELCELGATLGSDVPFCVVGGTRLCRGIGEKM
ncbi:MAG: 4-(cytidine 5'-diphospho)-2-C-methyl-D-erythritol kinase, partial [Clostridia bacterium]|nr:4-(cytidine 5'-diphospho)-2-C-methyl-D-erythritol kinase [Clostridia bacterium]